MYFKNICGFDVYVIIYQDIRIEKYSLFSRFFYVPLKMEDISNPIVLGYLVDYSKLISELSRCGYSKHTVLE